MGQATVERGGVGVEQDDDKEGVTAAIAVGYEKPVRSSVRHAW